MPETKSPFAEIVLHVHREPDLVCPLCTSDLITTHELEDDRIAIKTKCTKCEYRTMGIIREIRFVYSLD